MCVCSSLLMLHESYTMKVKLTLMPRGYVYPILSHAEGADAWSGCKGVYILCIYTIQIIHDGSGVGFS